MEEEVQVNEVINETQMELVSDPPHCTRESKRKRPVDGTDGKMPQPPKAPRGRERNKGRKASSGVKRQPKKPHNALSINRADRLLHYTSHLNFGLADSVREIIKDGVPVPRGMRSPEGTLSRHVKSHYFGWVNPLLLAIREECPLVFRGYLMGSHLRRNGTAETVNIW
ncbi:hypothetical protein L1987_19892 [Smallanthus sonchifolius]|uniref:Uncharacterized protein n=1 Tax=Smallanthus sonchifolius TaxID=185202 RepID=A0ACB9IS03_9ASTR|nr:hypothetical protein L1987_19892 [Smallanthus sonchifolius]